MLTKLAVSAFCLDVIDGARVNKRRRLPNTKETSIEGIPVHNYHLAFDQNRWNTAGPEFASAMSANQERWLLMMRSGISAEDLEATCSSYYTSCFVHRQSDSMPFVELHASEAELRDFLQAAKEKIGSEKFMFVEPDLPMSATPELPSTEQEETPWGLRRVRSRSLSNMPRGDPGKADGGKGVNVYVLDTGIRTTHEDFGDRAFPAMQLGWFNSVKQCRGDRNCALDKQGHGTHCAGTVGGITYGVAKGSLLHAVKVLSDTGGGSTAGIISGVDWLAGNAQKPAIASMSLGGGFSAAMNRAVDQLSASGVTVVTASGNNNDDSCIFSPGAAASTINVGSTDSNDQKSTFSNYGECQDIWAPGRGVLSAHPASDTATKILSGTSMACPHVSGAAAMLLSASPSLDPAAVKAKLIEQATADAVTGIPAYPATANLLLYMSE